MIQVCDPPRVRPVRRFSAEEFCFLLRGEAGSLYRPRSEVLRMLTVESHKAEIKKREKY